MSEETKTTPETSARFSYDGVGEKPVPMAGYNNQETYEKAVLDAEWAATQQAAETHRLKKEARKTTFISKVAKKFFSPRQ